MSGRLAAVFLQRFFDVVAIGRLKVAPFDARQALIEGELITRDRAVPEPTPKPLPSESITSRE